MHTYSIPTAFAPRASLSLPTGRGVKKKKERGLDAYWTDIQELKIRQLGDYAANDASN